MAIQVGDKAPDFTLTKLTEQGPELFTLSKATAGKKTVLLFFPMAFTGVCTTEFCDISKGLNAYTDLNAQVIGISGDNPFAQAEWAKKESITVPLLSDYEHTVAKEYGVAYESFLPEKNLTMGGVAKRSAFVIDSNGVVQYAEVHDSPGDLPDFDKIKSVLAEIS